MQPPAPPAAQLWTGSAIADMALESGLFSWLVDRTR
jgi:hypothetical protein